MTVERTALEEYLARGWRPIPLHHVVSQGCSCKLGAECGSPGKHPLMATWQREITYNDTWWNWWPRHPEANLGLLCGYSFWVLDVDPRHEGDVRLAELEAEHGPLPATYRVNTPSGGWHLYFLVPDWLTITNAKNALPRGLDVRGLGGQVAAPPSVGLDLAGKPAPYCGPYHAADEPLAMPPAWLLELMGYATEPGLPTRAAETGEANEDPDDEGPAAGGQPEPWTDEELPAQVDLVMMRQLAELAQAEPGGRNNALNTAAFSLATLIGVRGAPDDFEATMVDALRDVAQGLGLPANEIKATIASALRAGKVRQRRPNGLIPRDTWPPVRKVGRATISEFSPENEAGPLKLVACSINVGARIESQDDIGNGRRVRNWFGPVLRWVPERGKWSVYLHGRWVVSNEVARHATQRTLDLAAMHEAKRYSDVLPEPAEDEPKPRGKQSTDRERFYAWMAKQRMTTRVDAALKECAALPGMSAVVTDFDQRPFLLNCPNGTVELAGEEGVYLREHRPEDLLTQMTAVPWEPGAVSEEWDLFLKRVMPEQEVRAALQAACGYSVTGSTGSQVMFVHYGSGANGKSVFADVVSNVLGDMSQSAPRDTFAGHGGDRHPTDVARMQGKRFITTIEPRTGAGLDEDLIKQLTSGDRMAARYMRGDFFEFTPTGKIHYFTNHLPRVSADGAMWRRIRLFDWAVTIPEEERVLDLAQVLVKEAGVAVLAWLVEGYAAWHRGGLPRTDSQRARVEEWASDEDTLAIWIDEKCVVADDVFTSTHDLFLSWCEYAEASKMQPGTSSTFGRRLVEKGFVRHKSTGGLRGFKGLRRRMLADSSAHVVEDDLKDDTGGEESIFG